jgi:hypothetical protein
MASTLDSSENGKSEATHHYERDTGGPPTMMEQLAMAEGLFNKRVLQHAPNSCDSDLSVTTKSIASSTALVGESLVVETTTTSSYPNNRKQQTTTTTPSTLTHNWGISDTMNAGLEWIQRKRQERQQAALEQQVAEQRRILQQAQQQQQAQQAQQQQAAEEVASIIQYSRSGSGLSVNLVASPPDDAAAAAVQVRYVAESPEAPPFLVSERTMQLLLEQALPPAIAYSRWKRIYCLARDGDDFGEFLRKCHSQQHTLLVVQTTLGEVFGGYVESTWTPHSDGFYGLGQACLFSCKDDGLQVYKWTGANRYLQVCDAAGRMICIGGGGDSFGICLEQDFSVGSTGPCHTFANAPLCSQENFQVLNMEVYGFLLGQF